MVDEATEPLLIEDDVEKGEKDKDVRLAKSDSFEHMSTYNLYYHIIKAKKDSLHNNDDNEKLKLKQVTLFLVSLPYGVACVILPYTFLQLGPIIWMTFVAGICLLTAYCALLNKETYMEVTRNGGVAESLDNNDSIQDRIAELVVGPRFANFQHALTISFYAGASMVLMLLAASVLPNLVSEEFVFRGHSNTRIWLFVVMVLLLVLLASVREEYEFKWYAIATETFYYFSFFSIFINSLVISFDYTKQDVYQQVSDVTTVEHLFIAFGKIMFVGSGAALCIPNVLAIVKRPERAHTAIMWAYFIIYIIYIVAVATPYTTFGENLDPNYVVTLSKAIPKTHHNAVYYVIMIVTQIVLAMHFLLLCLLSVNSLLVSLQRIFLATGRSVKTC